MCLIINQQTYQVFGQDLYSQLLLTVAALDANGYSRVGKQKEGFSEKAHSRPTKRILSNEQKHLGPTHHATSRA